ncbi:AraC family transcriptional regulator [Paenibacillus sp. HJGM_3]|uniref:AraC family transcriptional regulator n=1 Tax=Paenibacillus sp. HJGM_3 TaxID=3379816 RepID=UPI00385EFD26
MNSSTYSVVIHPFPGRGELVVLFAGHEQTMPNHQVGPQVRDYYLIHHVVSGRGTFQCRGKQYSVEAGQSFVIFPGELIRYDSDAQEPWKYRWIAFKGTMASQLLSELGLSPEHPVAQPGEPRRTSAQLHRLEQTLARADAGCDLESGGLLRLVLSGYVRQERAPVAAGRAVHNPSDELVERAIRWLTLQYAQPVSIQHLAQSLGYHRTHLTKLFKQATGQSPMQYLLKIRMDRAKVLLLDDLTVEQVASSVGFADSLYFSKQFKRWHGCTPSEYRNGTGDPAVDPQMDCS